MRKLNTSGAVSMLSVAVFAIIITVIATVYIKSVTIQQRNALNFDYGTRALYASLAGFEDTKRYIAKGDLTPGPDRKKTTCPAEPAAANGGVLSSNLELSYTCQRITYGVLSLTASNVTTSDSFLFPIQPFAPPSGAQSYSLRITWTPGGNTQTSKTLPPQEAWISNGYAPMLRAQVIKTNKTLDRASMLSRSYFLNPSASADTQTADFAASDWTPTGSSVRNVVCTSASCSGTITLSSLNFDTQGAYLVVKPLYRQVDQVSVELISGTTALEMSGQADIDITGKAGNIFKRTKQSIAYGSVTPKKVEFPDYSIVGGDGLCKQMSLTTAAAGWQQGCIP